MCSHFDFRREVTSDVEEKKIDHTNRTEMACGIEPASALRLHTKYLQAEKSLKECFWLIGGQTTQDKMSYVAILVASGEVEAANSQH